MKKTFFILLPAVLIAVFLFFCYIFPKYTFPILMYHEIGYGEGSFYVSPENFNRQMEYIKKHGYKVITLDELAERIKNNKGFKRNEVVITFDDGYKNNFEYAYPVLKEFKFPATIFIITDFVGKAPSSDKDKQFLSWEEIRQMSKGQISAGSHTKSHFYLGGVVDDRAVLEELIGSKKAIERETGLPADYLCYPSGGFSQRVKELAAQAGYKGACTTNRGFVRFNRDVYELKRIKVTNSDTVKPFSFAVKLSGYYYVFKSDKEPG
ncbi:MAG: polysaccharide deacetylase family protein [Candidatus Omnitrophica bacterium]|jgi:peptidoglycan/xylan/chitin deacetylase (PgdA/CDA1 family)|nr:polysaccharide deacetylase family protein [Candidatus Omnitrophota bacterium]